MTLEMVGLTPATRLLCGPGPSNVDDAVLDAMQRPMLGHLDPDYHELMLELMELLREVYGAPQDGGFVFPLQATGTSGMETGLTNLLEPGDTAIVGVCGFFGRRIVEIAQRCGANVETVQADWGEAVSNDELLAALDRHPDARLVAVVHAETSTGVQHPVAELAAEMADRDTLLLVDCVTSLGGVPLNAGEWGIDFAYSCTQKCLAAPPGLSPLLVSEAAMRRVDERTSPVPFSFDLRLLRDYWIKRPVSYHHTAPILHMYALFEALRSVLAEGLEARWARHATAGTHLQRAIVDRGLELLADPEHQLAPLTAVRVPDDVDGPAVQRQLLREHGIEIGGGLGPAAPPMWRIGLMGRNASVETADRVLQALDAVLADQ